jgi:hypothetical protein
MYAYANAANDADTNTLGYTYGYSDSNAYSNSHTDNNTHAYSND